ncbi:MAG: hypothetical protein ACI4O9_02025 [Akkermansia sp.]
MKLDIIDKACSVKDIEFLLSNSDWYIWEKVSSKDIERIAKLLMEYIKGGEDNDFSYITEDGAFKENSLSNYLSENELNIRCIAMSDCTKIGARFAASLMYFRYCYDHSTYMELTQLERVLLRTDEKDSDAFLKAIINIMMDLEREYNKRQGYVEC